MISSSRGELAGGVLAVAERGLRRGRRAISKRRRALAPFELVDQSAGLQPVRGRDEADAAAVGELLDVGELAVGGWVVWRPWAPPCGGAGWSRGSAACGARCHAPGRARKPVRVDAGRARRRLAAAPAPPRRAWPFEPSGVTRACIELDSARCASSRSSICRWSSCRVLGRAVTCGARTPNERWSSCCATSPSWEWLFRIEEIELGELELELTTRVAGAERVRSEQDLPGEGSVAALCEQVAGEVQVDVVAGGEHERLLLGPAGAERAARSASPRLPARYSGSRCR